MALDMLDGQRVAGRSTVIIGGVLFVLACGLAALHLFISGTTILLPIGMWIVAISVCIRGGRKMLNARQSALEFAERTQLPPAHTIER